MDSTEKKFRLSYFEDMIFWTEKVLRNDSVIFRMYRLQITKIASTIVRPIPTLKCGVLRTRFIEAIFGIEKVNSDIWTADILALKYEVFTFSIIRHLLYHHKRYLHSDIFYLQLLLPSVSSLPVQHPSLRQVLLSHS
jgi:hypothetical protein